MRRRRFISPGAFRPDTEYLPKPGLGDRIERLQRAGRYRSALDVLFRILDENPADAEALFLASLIVSVSRTQQLTAAEPLGPRYQYDRRLDPIWAVCCKCGAAWVPTPALFSLNPYASVQTLNPIGMQCPECGYTLCRDCLHGPTLGVSVYSSRCPYCPGFELGLPVLPTRRPPMQLARYPLPIRLVAIFREGPIPPDKTYMRSLLEARSPDAVDEQVEVLGIPLQPWPESIEAYAIAYLLALNESRGFGRSSFETSETGTLKDDHGVNVHLVKLYHRFLIQ